MLTRSIYSHIWTRPGSNQLLTVRLVVEDDGGNFLEDFYSESQLLPRLMRRFLYLQYKIYLFVIICFPETLGDRTT